MTNSAHLSEADAARAVIFGLALGDALGWPVEFLERPQILARYGREGITAPPDLALYTDDTQMSAAVAEALIGAGDASAVTDLVMGAMVIQFIAWKNDPITSTRAPGTTCIRGVSALERGAHWRAAGVKGSKGCGACMRVAPIGYFYQHDPKTLARIARAQGWLTHRHPASDAACIGAAYLVKLALDGVTPDNWIEHVLTATAGISGEFDAAMGRVNEAAAWPDAETALNYIGPTRGGGWIAEEAVGMALSCALRHPDDYVAAVRLGANISGDSDSVAGIAGGILGARLGLSAIPADWVERLENRDYLNRLAARLAEKKTTTDISRKAL